MIQKITYEKFGSGSENIIFLHAFPLDGRMWAQQILVLKDQYTLFVPDMRCFGKNLSNDAVFCTIDTYADDILQMMNDENLNKAVLCGLSIGGYIILRCMQKFPERISKVILADTKAENDDNTGLLNRAATITKLQDGKQNEVIEGLLGKLMSKHTIDNKPRVVTDVREMMEQQTALAMQSATAALAMRINSKEFLKDIKVPALILVGADDALTPPVFSQTLNEQIAGSILHTIQNAGHLSNMEQPEEFNALVMKFLET
ncbi:MAG: alpha/beta fold hydrolase [Chitinophagales bacterium]